MTLSEEPSITWKFPVNVARAILAQLLIVGLDYIHTYCVVRGSSSPVPYPPPRAKQLGVAGPRPFRLRV